MRILIVSDYDCACYYCVAEYIDGKLNYLDDVFGDDLNDNVLSAFDAFNYLEAKIIDRETEYYMTQYPEECKIVDSWLATYDDIIFCRDGGISIKKGK